MIHIQAGIIGVVNRKSKDINDKNWKTINSFFDWENAAKNFADMTNDDELAPEEYYYRFIEDLK